MKSKIISALGAVLSIYGVILCVFSNYNLGVMLVVAVGIIILCAGIFESKLIKFKTSKLFRIFRILFILFLCMETVLIGFTAVYGVSDNADFNEDAVIVPGAGVRGDKVTLPLKLRLDTALEYHRKNPGSVIVVSGGQGLQETVTEAYAMEQYLIRNGVDKSKIVKEEKATSTSENMKYSKELLDDLFSSDYSVVVVTNNFHIFRATTMAEKTGFQKVAHMHAGLQWYNLMPCYLRESLAVLKMLILG